MNNAHAPNANPLRLEMPNIFDGDEEKNRPSSVTIHRKSVEEVFAFFRDVANFPRFMKNIVRVEELGGGRLRWTGIRGGREVTWDTESVGLKAPNYLAWRTLGDERLPEAAALTFEPAPGGRGTVVGFKIAYLSSPGKIRALAEKLKGEDPENEAAITLRRFKALLETGEVPTVEGQPTGREKAESAA